MSTKKTTPQMPASACFTSLTNFSVFAQDDEVAKHHPWSKFGTSKCFCSGKEHTS